MKTITLIRHGESEGNVDKTIYSRKPDYALRLTPNGRSQAYKAGELYKKVIGNGKIAFYCSPFFRTRDTFFDFRKGGDFGADKVYLHYEDSRLREQEWGQRPGMGFDSEMESLRDRTGHYYFRFPNGESCADVENRISSFLNTLNRDLEKPGFPDHVAIITHGMAMRVFIKRWFHLSVEEFELMRNPPNCSFYQLVKNKDKYDLSPEFTFATHPAPCNEFQYSRFDD